MPSKVCPLLPILHQKPMPFIKVFRRHVPLIFILLVLTLIVLYYGLSSQIRTALNDMASENQGEVPSVIFAQPSDNVLDENSNNEVNIFKSLKELNINRKPLKLPSGEEPDPKVKGQRLFIKDMMKHSWDSYVKYAWGQNELRPISKTGHSHEIFGGDNHLGATIVDSLSTLYIMNMTEEFERARHWVYINLDLSAVNSYISVFETTIRFVGGLLSAFSLTSDLMFLQKAKHVADRMLPAFDTPTGIPLGVVNPSTGKARNHGIFYWFTGGYATLAGLGSLHLEFIYLSAVTGDLKYAQRVKKIRKFMDRITKPYEGLYINYINPYTGEWGDDIVSIGGQGDSYYEYLVKSWLQSNRTDTQARRMYDSAVDAISKKLVQKSRSGMIYLAKQNSGRLEHKMGHLTCFSGGMFALGSLHLKDENRRKYFFQLGANITHTCHESYKRTATHIGPEEFHFTEHEEAVAPNSAEKYYILRPEVIESYFYLWRLTHDQRFRDYAWNATQAIAKHCRTDNGFSGIRDTSGIYSAKDDVQQTFFLAETLKYLYLIFSSDDLIPLSEWVFNTEAHPLPVLSPVEIYRTGIIS